MKAIGIVFVLFCMLPVLFALPAPLASVMLIADMVILFQVLSHW